MSASEVRRILAVIPPRSPFGARDRAMLVFLLHTGLRVSEVCGLTIGDVYPFLEAISLKNRMKTAFQKASH